jgi:hypothetical protein
MWDIIYRGISCLIEVTLYVYCSDSEVLGKLRWVGYVTRIGEKRNAYTVLVGNPLCKIYLGRLR